MPDCPPPTCETLTDAATPWGSSLAKVFLPCAPLLSSCHRAIMQSVVDVMCPSDVLVCPPHGLIDLLTDDTNCKRGSTLRISDNFLRKKPVIQSLGTFDLGRKLWTEYVQFFRRKLLYSHLRQLFFSNQPFHWKSAELPTLTNCWTFSWTIFEKHGLNHKSIYSVFHSYLWNWIWMPTSRGACLRMSHWWYCCSPHLPREPGVHSASAWYPSA